MAKAAKMGASWALQAMQCWLSKRLPFCKSTNLNLKRSGRVRWRKPWSGANLWWSKRQLDTGQSRFSATFLQTMKCFKESFDYGMTLKLKRNPVTTNSRSSPPTITTTTTTTTSTPISKSAWSLKRKSASSNPKMPTK